MMRLVLFVFSFFLPCLILGHETSQIVCVHGFLEKSKSMNPLAKELSSESNKVINWGYKSRNAYIQDHAKALVAVLNEVKQPSVPIHFVAHSMGSLVVRAALNDPDCPREAKIGRAVLLGPPNQGAIWARKLGKFSICRKVMKDYSGKELALRENFSYLGEFPPSVEVLVIAGSFSLNPFIGGENDGRVTLEETYLTTPHTHVVINRGHNTMLSSKEAVDLTKAFLKEGPSSLQKM